MVSEQQSEQVQNTNGAEKFSWKKAALITAGAVIGLLFLFVSSVIALRWVNPSITAFTIQENWAELQTERPNLRENWIDFGDIPDHMIWAVVASEDQRFFEHRGIDWEAVEEAWEERQSGERIRGASTITQQVAKNLYLSPAQSFFRKGIEAVIAVMIELFWSKERILEVYLNIAEFGPGVFGIGMAAEQFYNQPAAQFEPEQSAVLAAVLPSPKRMRVEPPSPFAEERSRWILRQMTMITGIAYVDITTRDPGRLYAETEEFLSKILPDEILEPVRVDEVPDDAPELPLPELELEIFEIDTTRLDE